jgi:hypothetical protein
MTRILGSILIFIGASAALLADGALVAPEINAGSAVSAIALLSGGLLVLRARRRP